jgi:tripartite-type tricarboxylate transporter receptor subunit TctC
LAIGVGVAGAAPAQKYPVKPVRMIVPYAAGGPVDLVGRLVAQRLSERWGQQAVVENRGGSGGALGTIAVVKAAPDGYTLLVGNSGPITVYPHLRKAPAYSFERDLEPVAFMISSCMVLIGHPSIPAKSIRELVQLAKKRPGAMTYASSGIGGLQHLGMELFKSRAGVELVHVPYKGAAPALVDLVSGQVDLMFNNVLISATYVRNAKVRGFAVSTAKPSPSLPEVPPVATVYPGFDVHSWMGIYAPPGTPKELIATLHRDIAAVLNLPESKQRLNELGAEVVAGGPEELSAFARRESELFGKIIAATGIPKE